MSATAPARATPSPKHLPSLSARVANAFVADERVDPVAQLPVGDWHSHKAPLAPNAGSANHTVLSVVLREAANCSVIRSTVARSSRASRTSAAVGIASGSAMWRP